jgi:hypothetical protein
MLARSAREGGSAALRAMLNACAKRSFYDPEGILGPLQKSPDPRALRGRNIHLVARLHLKRLIPRIDVARWTDDAELPR